MVKNLKKTLALMLSIIMILSSTVTTFADDEVAKSTENPAQIEETVQAEAVEAEAPTEAPKVEAVTEEQPAAEPTQAEKPSTKAVITEQPEDASVYVNAEAEFTLAVNGKVKSCQWQMAKTRDGVWSNLSRRQYGATETLKIRALQKYDKRFFRCIVTFDDDTTAVSKEARLNIVEKDTYPAQSFGSIKDTKVVAPEGAFPAGTSMEANEVDDTAAVQSIIDDMDETDGVILNAVDISFYKSGEIQPKEAVKVTMNVGTDVDFENLVLVHVNANADELDKANLETEVVDFTYNETAGTITFEADHFSTFILAAETEEVEGTPAYNAGEAGDPPASKKTLTPNGDGTYTLALEVTGKSSSSSTTEVTRANVVLVLDVSSSMNSNRTTYKGQNMTRFNAEKHVLCDDGGIVDQLLSKNKTAYPDIIEVSVATFGRNGATASNWTTNGTALKNTINGLNYSTGTNWEEGLMYAERLADDIKGRQPNEDVYIIFMTDGEPTTHNNSYNVNQNFAQEWGYASDNARTLVTDGYKFYGLFTWGNDNRATYLSSLVQYAYTGQGNSSSSLAPAYAQYFTDATDTDALIAALNAIIHNITESVGYTDVELEDGITEMTASSVHADVSGDVTGLKYYRKGGDYSTEGYGEEWKDAPHATITEEGRVKWDLGEGVDHMLEDGVTYTVTFKVWPSQESLDLVADLNNGLADYDKLDEDQKAMIIRNGNVYTLKTNTDFPTVHYRTVTTTTVDGQTTTVESDPATVRIANPDPVSLAGSEMEIQKIWAVDLQTSRLHDLLYNKDGSSRKLTVSLDVMKDDDPYETVTLGWKEDEEGNGKYEWADEAETIWAEKFAVAPGVMVTDASFAADAEFTTTYNGKTYYVLETGHDYVIKENDFKDYHFDLVTEPYHPMVVDGELKDVKFNGTTVESMTPEKEELSSLDATNTLRGGINLKKIVLDPDGKEYPTEDEFEFIIKLDNDSEVFVGDSIPWYSVNGNYYHDDEGNFISEDEAKEKYGDDYQKQGNVLSGSAKSVTGEIKITSQDTVRIANVPVGTTYTVTESAADGFTLDSIDHEVALDGETEEAEAEIDLTNRKITGEIVPNRENNITYKNKMDSFPAFYVYHSSDKTIEKVFVDDPRVTRTQDQKTGLSTYTFNIVNETKEKNYYGGYFSAYGGAGMKDAEIIAAKYENSDSAKYAYATKATATKNWATDSKGKAYDYDGPGNAWWTRKAAYKDVSGLNMKVAINTVYYLKEVPEEYFRPALYYVYDDNSEKKDLKQLYLMVPTDDNIYQFVCGKPITMTQNKKLYGTFTATGVDGEESYTVTKANSNLKKGYLTVWDGATYMVKDKSYEWTPNFVTLDGVEVTSYVTRTIKMGDLCYGTAATNFSSSDVKVASTVAAYKAE